MCYNLDMPNRFNFDLDGPFGINIVSRKMMRLLLIVVLVGCAGVVAREATPTKPNWFVVDPVSFADLEFTLSNVRYPLTVVALMEKLGLKGRVAWQNVTSQHGGGLPERMLESIAITDPEDRNGHYGIELELKNLAGGDVVNEVKKARLYFTTAAGIRFYADDVEKLQPKNSANHSPEPPPSAAH